MDNVPGRCKIEGIAISCKYGGEFREERVRNGTVGQNHSFTR